MVSEAGRRPVAVAGVTTPASIDTVQTITVPTGIQRPEGSGIMECTVIVEGTVASRYTINGVTPTAAVGHPLPASAAGSPQTLVLRGEAMISAFKIIGAAAGNSMTYFFTIVDTR